jgi:hypothetical protein
MASLTCAKDYLHSWYREYEFTTAVYLLEPWEKRTVNVAMSGIALFSLYASYYYLPHYSKTFAHFVGLN